MMKRSPSKEHVGWCWRTVLCTSVMGALLWPTPRAAATSCSMTTVAKLVAKTKTTGAVKTKIGWKGMYQAQFSAITDPTLDQVTVLVDDSLNVNASKSIPLATVLWPGDPGSCGTCSGSGTNPIHYCGWVHTPTHWLWKVDPTCLASSGGVMKLQVSSVSNGQSVAVSAQIRSAATDDPFTISGDTLPLTATVSQTAGCLATNFAGCMGRTTPSSVTTVRCPGSILTSCVCDSGQQANSNCSGTAKVCSSSTVATDCPSLCAQQFNDTWTTGTGTGSCHSC
jgi:hypothetical protein